MTKIEFCEELSRRLEDLPAEELERSLSYYSESIDDRMDEDGISEEEAVAALGSIDEIVANIKSEMSLGYVIKSKISGSRNNASDKKLWLILAIVGSVVWVPLAIAFIAVVFSLYVALWSIIIALFAVVGAFFVSGFSGVVASVFGLGMLPGGFPLLLSGGSIILISLGLFLIKPVITASKEIVHFTAFLAKKIKKAIIGKEKCDEIQ